MNKQINISVAFSLDLNRILNELAKKNSDIMAQLGNITIRYIGAKEDTENVKREIFEIERLCK